MAYAGNIVAEVVVTRTVVWAMTGSVTVVAMVMVVVMKIKVVMVVVIVGVVPIRGVPTPVIAIPIVGAIPVVVIVPRVVIAIIAVIAVAVWVESPVPAVAYIDIGVARAVAVASIIVVVIIHGGACIGAETLDAGSKVLVVVGFGGGVNHAVGIGHRFGGLIHRIDVGLVILAIGIICLIVVRGAAADARGGASGCACVLFPRVVVGRIIGVIVSHLFVG